MGLAQGAQRLDGRPARLHSYRDNLERAAGTLPPATDGSARMFLKLAKAWRPRR